MTGDPDTAENTAKLAARHDARSGTIGQGPFAGFGEDIPDEDIGRAMLAVAKHGFPKQILEIKDIQAASKT